MIYGEVASILARGAKALGIELPPSAAEMFETFCDFLEERRKNVSLTAIKGAEDITKLHFLDSIAILSAAQLSRKRVIDIGSGAGFPGAALKIAEPSIDLTLMDSATKRISFLTSLCTRLNIDAACIHARAEAAAHNTDLRESYDVAISRAVARLNVLSELCIPFVRVGGLFIAMKGPDPAEELAEAGGAIETLGASIQEIFYYTIPETDVTHSAILIRKTAMTADIYPRRFARIQNSPLS